MIVALALFFGVAGCDGADLRQVVSEGQPEAQRPAMEAKPLVSETMGVDPADELLTVCSNRPEKGRPQAMKPSAEGEPSMDWGTFTVDFSDELLTVRSNRAPRLSVVKRVAQAAGFELVTGDVEPQKLTVRIENSPLALALPELLTHVPYVVEYVFNADREIHHLARLRVGEIKGVPADKAIPPDDETKTKTPLLADENWRAPPPVDDETFDGLLGEVEELVIEEADLFDRAASTAAVVRAEAIEEVPVAGEGLEVVLDTLALDEDPEVRAAAALRLAEAEGFATINSLISAIEDPSPEVAQQAIHSLVAIGDRSVVSYLQDALEQHSDPTVQQALEEGIRTIWFSVRMDSDEIEMD
jgi:hypothetical protein